MNCDEAWDDTCSAVGSVCRNSSASVLDSLLKQGRSVDVSDNRGWRPIHDAAFNNNVECARILCSRQENDVDWRTFEGETAMLLAARQGHSDICGLLLQNGADVDRGDMMERTPLMGAARGGHLAVVKLLVTAGCQLNRRDDQTESSALHQAVESSSMDVVKFLVSANSKLDLVDKHGRSPVFIAAEESNADILHLLLDEAQRRGDTPVINLVAKDGASPLMVAAQKASKECVQMLLHYGADANLITKDFAMALHRAIDGQCVKCVQMILNSTDRDVLRYYLYGPWRKRQSAEHLRCPRSSITVSHIYLNACPFHLAIERDGVGVLDVLLDSDLDPNDYIQSFDLGLEAYIRTFDVFDYNFDRSSCHLTGPNGVTAVGHAVSVQNEHILRHLLERGCPADPDCYCNVSALTIAVQDGWKPGVRLLLEHGADPNFPMKQTGRAHPYALFFALWDPEIMLLLRRFGADLRLFFNQTQHYCRLFETFAELLRYEPNWLDHFYYAMGVNAIVELRMSWAADVIDFPDDFGPCPSLKLASAIAVRNCVLDARPRDFRAAIHSLGLPIQLTKFLCLDDKYS